MFSSEKIGPVVLKLFSLRRRWKSLLGLRRTSNKMLIQAHISKFYLLLMKKQKQIGIINAMCGLAHFH